MRSTTGSATPKRAAISRQMRRSLACRRTRKPAGKAPRTMLGARCTKYQLEPAPLPRVSISLSSGNPWACANAMASATASTMPAHMIWLLALAASPLPVGPRCALVRPSACRIGSARSKPAGVPPARMASVASRAPSTPPLTGQSRNSTPRGARSSAAGRAVSAPMVEQSSISVPDFSPAARARATSSTSASADTHDTTTSMPAASCSRVAGAATPSSDASVRAFSAVRFQTALSIPARCRLRAMCVPMAPSPTRPTRMAVCIPCGRNGRGRHYRASVARTESTLPGSPRDLLRLGYGFRFGDGLRLGYRLVGSELRHAAAAVLHVLARLLAIGVGRVVREVLALAVLVFLEDAARLNGLHVAVLRRLALCVARLGHVLLHRPGVGLIVEVRGDAVVRAAEVLLLAGTCRGVESRRARLDGLDDHRSRHPLIAVMRHAVLIDPAIDIGPCDGERSGQNQEGDG